jgi:hypothetical protein
MFQRQPVAVLLGASYALRDEVHAIHAVRHVGIEAPAAVHLLAAGAGGHIGVRGRIDVRKRFEECFGMAAGKPSGSLGSFRHVGRVRIARRKPERLAVDPE